MDQFQDAHPGFQSNQIRGQADGRFYAPNRDFAYVGPALIKQALVGLSPVTPEGTPDDIPTDSPYYPLLKDLTGDEQRKELGDFARTLALLIGRSVRTTGLPIADVAATLKQEGDPGMSACWQVKTAVLARLGEMTLGCIFAAIQDVTPEGGQPPHMRSIESLVDVADRLSLTIRNVKT